MMEDALQLWEQKGKELMSRVEADKDNACLAEIMRGLMIIQEWSNESKWGKHIFENLVKTGQSIQDDVCKVFSEKLVAILQEAMEVALKDVGIETFQSSFRAHI